MSGPAEVNELRLDRASDPEVFGAALAGGLCVLTENVGDFTRIAAEHSAAGEAVADRVVYLVRQQAG